MPAGRGAPHDGGTSIPTGENAMAQILPARPVPHPVRPAPLLTRALAAPRPWMGEPRPFADITSLLQRRSQGGEVASAVGFEIANLGDIAVLAGAHAARHACEVVASRRHEGIAGPHRPEPAGAGRFVVAAPLPLEAAIDFAKGIIATLAQPIVYEKVCIQVAIAVTVGRRRNFPSRFAEAA
jgi:hypothetical protein